jgi:hypothetical protein
VPVTQPPTLSQRWMIGIEHMRSDPLILQPLTNRFLADLAGMPEAQVVYLGVDLNSFQFNAYASDKLRVYPWLRAEGNCMEFTYIIYRAGQQVRTYGLVVPALAAGPEADTACVDRAASSFYHALTQQGL